MNKIVILSHIEPYRNALKKNLQIMFKESLFLISDIAPPPDIKQEEYIVSEAMKWACNHNIPVILIGINKNDTFEAGIKCKQFDLIKFLPFPVSYAKIVSTILSTSRSEPFGKKKNYPVLNAILCEKKCSVLNKRKNKIFASEFLRNEVCHEIKNIRPLVLKENNIMNFIDIADRALLLNKLFIPVYEKTKIENFLVELSILKTTALNSGFTIFKDEYQKFRQNENLLRGFPHLDRRKKW